MLSHMPKNDVVDYTDSLMSRLDTAHSRFERSMLFVDRSLIDVFSLLTAYRKYKKHNMPHLSEELNMTNEATYAITGSSAATSISRT